MFTRDQVPTLFNELRKLCDPNCFVTLPDLTRNEMEGLSLFEDDDHLYLEAAVPGVTSDEIQISVEKGVVWIKAEQQIEQKKKDVKVHFQAVKRYSYRIPLPIRIDDQSQPEAVCKDGVLRISFVKSRSSKPMKIAVKAS